MGVFCPKQVEEAKDNDLSHLKVNDIKLLQQSLEEDPRAKVKDDFANGNKLQFTSEDTSSKTSAFVHTAKPDLMYDTKSIKKDKIMKLHMTQSVETSKEMKQDSNKIALSNLGGPKDGIVVAIVGTSHETLAILLDAENQVIMPTNERNGVVFSIHGKTKRSREWNIAMQLQKSPHCKQCSTLTCLPRKG